MRVHLWQWSVDPIIGTKGTGATPLFALCEPNSHGSLRKRLHSTTLSESTTMAVTINKTSSPAETQAEPVTISPEVNVPVETSTPEKPRKRNNHSRALDIQGIDLNTDQRLLMGHVLSFMKTTDTTLARWIDEGNFPEPDGKQGRRSFWFSATIRPHVQPSA